MGRASDPLAVKSEKSDLASRRAADRMLKRLATRLEQLDRWVDEPPDDGIRITGVRLRTDGVQYGEDVLCIITAERGGESIVAFHGGETLLDALSGMVGRLVNGSLKWRPDEFAKKKE